MWPIGQKRPAQGREGDKCGAQGGGRLHEADRGAGAPAGELDRGGAGPG